MKIVLIDAVPDDVLKFVLAGNVVYRPDLRFKSTSIVVAALEEIAADAVIASARALDPAVRAFAQGRAVLHVRVTVGPAPIASDVFEDTNSLKVVEVSGDDASSAYATALDVLEHRATEMLPMTRPSKRFEALRGVTFVGAGVVNLVTAYHLQEAGYDIHLVDAGAEPRSDAPWLDGLWV